MIHCDQEPVNKLAIPVPKNSDIHGEWADEVARLAWWVMRLTALTKERILYGHYIPLSKATLTKMFGAAVSHKVKQAAREHTWLFDFNDRYSDRPGSSFPQSIRLQPECRTGEAIYHTLRRKPRAKESILDLDEIATELMGRFDSVWLPDCLDFDNPWQMFTVSQIREKHWFALRCDFGRFHSNFTNCKHRHYLQSRWPLTALDVQCCQPALLGLLAKRRFPGPDALEWENLCQRGVLYEEFGKEIGVNDRATIKDSVIKTIFDRVWAMEKCPYFQVIESRWPSVASYLRQRKAEGGYQRVAHDMQSLESLIMIDGVAATITKDYKGIPVITCHDEVMVPINKVDYVRRVMAGRFKKAGIVVSLKEKPNQ
jgi:hypothetical protein